MKPDGKFYLGKEYSPGKELLSGDNYLYEAEDLTTHGVVFGMTGSGKTGLCIDLLEEAVAEEIPITIVDPKGDVANLALMFPELSPRDFTPWVSAAEAKKEGKTVEVFAEGTAGKWKKGLGGWGITPETVKSLKDKMDVKIFTPGSSAGMPVSIIEGFQKPEGNFQEDEEGMIEKINNSVSALLSLLDIESDPLTSKPHILISNIIQHYWRMGRSVSIEDLIINIQKPPVKKLGVFDVNQLIDEKERVELAFQINNVIASPGFRFWTSGQPLSAESLYQRRNGKTPVNIFYIAHLSENERMFFVSLLLNELVYWIRQQRGATELKSIFYMDEIFGYLPPYPGNPPSKKPLMILLKQARAFGLGVVLVTQNPKDIDYKALTNTGTWFIGKLQAEGDRERVLEGLRGAVDTSGETIDSGEIQAVMASLQKRVFLVKNVHEKGVKTFHTRWAISYLAGPLTREQIKELVKEKKLSLMDQGTAVPDAGREVPGKEKISGLLPFAPLPEVQVEYLYESAPGSPPGPYAPSFYLEGEVIFDDNRLGIYVRKKYATCAPLKSAIDWREADVDEHPAEYAGSPDEEAAGFLALPVKLSYTVIKGFQSSFKNHLFSTLALKLLINRELNIVSEVDEKEEAFRQRCRDVVEKMIDKEVEKLKDNYERKIKRIENSIQREEVKIKKLEGEFKSKRTEEFLSIGESVLGLLLGGKSRRGLSSAARKRRSTSTAAGRLEMGKTRLSQLEEKMLALKEELEDRVADIEDSHYEQADSIGDFEIRLEKEDIIIARQAILWRLQE